MWTQQAAHAWPLTLLQLQPSASAWLTAASISLFGWDGRFAIVTPVLDEC